MISCLWILHLELKIQVLLWTSCFWADVWSDHDCFLAILRTLHILAAEFDLNHLKHACSGVHLWYFVGKSSIWSWKFNFCFGNSAFELKYVHIRIVFLQKYIHCTCWLQSSIEISLKQASCGVYEIVGGQVTIYAFFWRA